MNQLSFFPETTAPVRAAAVKGERAGRRCAAKARTVGFDTEGARRFILGWLARFGDQSGEQLTDALKGHGFKWHDARCVGPLFQSMARRGEIRCVRSDLPRAKGHSTSGGRLWSRVAV